jgi:hypothetical protein
MHTPDPAVTALLTSVWPQTHRTDATGDLARFLRTAAVPPVHMPTDVHLREQLQRQLDTGAILGAPATVIQQLLDLPPLSALGRWSGIEHMRDAIDAAHRVAFEALVAQLEAA